MNQMMPIFKKEAEGLASLGRYGDSYMVHAAEGETVIPGEILDANPGLKQQLFHQMQMMGIENPNRYVVGSALNSLNPITGQPEFFWKKLWKATKRSLPAIGAIVANRFMPGSSIGTGIGAGLGSLASGKSLKKSALIGGVTGVTSSALAALKDKDNKGFVKSFFDDVTENPIDAFKKGPATGIMQALGGKEENLESMRDLPEFVDRGGRYEALPTLPEYRNDAVTRKMLSNTPELTSMEALPELASKELTSMRGLPEFASRELASKELTSMRDLPEFANRELTSMRGLPEFTGELTSMRGLPEFTGRELTSMRGLPEFVGRGRQYDAPPEFAIEKGAYPAQVPEDLLANVTPADVLARQNTPVENRPAGIEALKEAFNPFKKDVFAPGITASIASEALDPEKRTLSAEDVAEARRIGDPQYSSYVESASLPQGSNEYYQARRDAGIYSTLTAEQLAASTGITLEQAQAYLTRKYGPTRTAADGGEIVGPGTGTSDSIDAKLSDGEFVMTAEAVRNAGNGDRDLGAARMYDMMSRFERGMA